MCHCGLQLKSGLHAVVGVTGGQNCAHVVASDDAAPSHNVISSTLDVESPTVQAKVGFV